MTATKHQIKKEVTAIVEILFLPKSKVFRLWSFRKMNDSNFVRSLLLNLNSSRFSAKSKVSASSTCMWLPLTIKCFRLMNFWKISLGNL